MKKKEKTMYVFNQLLTIGCVPGAGKDAADQPLITRVRGGGEGGDSWCIPNKRNSREKRGGRKD